MLNTNYRSGYKWTLPVLICKYAKNFNYTYIWIRIKIHTSFHEVSFIYACTKIVTYPICYSHFLNEGQEVTHIFALGYSHINLHRLSLCIAFLSFHLQGTLNKLLIFVTRHFKKSLFSCKTSRIIIKSYSPSEKKRHLMSLKLLIK